MLLLIIVIDDRRSKFAMNRLDGVYLIFYICAQLPCHLDIGLDLCLMIYAFRMKNVVSRMRISHDFQQSEIPERQGKRVFCMPPFFGMLHIRHFLSCRQPIPPGPGVTGRPGRSAACLRPQCPSRKSTGPPWGSTPSESGGASPGRCGAGCARTAPPCRW